MLAILKLGIGRDELPEILKEEINRYESMVAATLAGEFSAEPVGFRIGWHEGMIMRITARLSTSSLRSFRLWVSLLVVSLPFLSRKRW